MHCMGRPALVGSVALVVVAMGPEMPSFRKPDGDRGPPNLDVSASARATKGQAPDQDPLLQVLAPAREPKAWVLIINRYLRSLFYVLNLRTLLHCVVACGLVWLCIYFKIRFFLNFDVVSVGTVFPLVFAIQQAYTRREQALRSVADLKGAMWGLYFCHRDWDIRDGVNVRSTLGNNSTEHAQLTARLIRRFLTALREYLAFDSHFVSMSEQRLVEQQQGRWAMFLAPARTHTKSAPPISRLDKLDYPSTLLMRAYQQLNHLTILNERLTAMAGYPKAGEGGMSRVAQYIRQATADVEMLRNLKEYRTPEYLRSACIVLINVCTVLLAPYFAQLGSQQNSMWYNDRGSDATCPAGYIAASMYLIITHSLYRVMSDLEQPFDGVGLDDVRFELDTEFEECVAHYEEQRLVSKDRGNKDVWAAGASHLDPDYSVHLYQHYIRPRQVHAQSKKPTKAGDEGDDESSSDDGSDVEVPVIVRVATPAIKPTDALEVEGGSPASSKTGWTANPLAPPSPLTSPTGTRPAANGGPYSPSRVPNTQPGLHAIRVRPAQKPPVLRGVYLSHRLARQLLKTRDLLLSDVHDRTASGIGRDVAAAFAGHHGHLRSSSINNSQRSNLTTPFNSGRYPYGVSARLARVSASPDNSAPPSPSQKATLQSLPQPARRSSRRRRMSKDLKHLGRIELSDFERLDGGSPPPEPEGPGPLSLSGMAHVDPAAHTTTLRPSSFMMMGSMMHGANSFAGFRAGTGLAPRLSGGSGVGIAADRQQLSSTPPSEPDSNPCHVELRLPVRLPPVGLGVNEPVKEVQASQFQRHSDASHHSR